MKDIFLILLVTTFAISANAQSGRRGATTRTTTTAPIQAPLTPDPEPAPREASGPLLSIPESFREKSIKALDNTSFKLSDFEGKVVVINLWASWCGPCRHEVPEYDKVRRAYAGRNVEFIGLTAEDPRTALNKVNKFVRELNFGFRLGWADLDLARVLMDGKASIPQTLVLDGEGRILSHWAGYSSATSATRLKQAIEGALAR
ncbi:MAG TPA: TlpA disulfide reductase family protein [Pyrinomonadaceae bacterium]